MKTSLRFAPALLALSLFASALAQAHAVGMSRGDYRLEGAEVATSLTFARAELGSAADPAALVLLIQSGLIIAGDGKECPWSVESVDGSAPDALLIRGRAHCAAQPSHVTLRLPVLTALPPGHRHLAHVSIGTHSVDAVLYAQSAEFSAEAAAPPSAWSTIGSFIQIGMVHIFSGYDHLAFLIALILVGGQRRRLIGLVTAFTVAHSITLSAAALGVFALSPRLVEPAIALSIAYVAVENWFVRNADHRWKLTFLFGLVHGFGFASALREISIPRTQLVPALISFNGGVELGQLAVLAAVLPLVAWARRSPWFVTRGVRGLSALLGLMGLAWFVERVGMAL